MSLEKRDIWTETWRAHWDNGGRDWSDAAASQGISGTDSHHQKLGKGEEESYPTDLRGNMALLSS